MSWNIARAINNIQFDVIDLQGKTQNIVEAVPDETKFVGDVQINESSVVTETTLTPLIQPLTEKTLYIQLPLSLNGTIFNQNVYADKFLINGDTAPPKKLYSDGTTTTQGDLIFLDGEPVNQDVNRTYFDKSLNYYAATDANFPLLIGSPIYNGNVYNITNEIELEAYLANGMDLATLVITQNITLTSTKTVSRMQKIMGGSSNIKIDGNFSTALFNVTSSAVTFDYITLSNPNTSSNASLINFSGTNNTCFVTSCYLETNEFAITSNIKNLVVKGNLFIFIGAADSHRYIFLTGCLGTCYVIDNVFNGNTGASTQCININNGVASNFLNGKLVIKSNYSTINPVQRLLMVDISLAGSNFSIYASNNSLSCTSGFMIFFASPLDGIKQIYLYNNTETLGGAATGSKGLIGIDSASSSVISFNTKIYSAKNTVPLLRADYTDLVAPAANQPRVVAYATARFTPGVNKYDMIIPLVGNANSGAVVPVDISGLESKTQNLNATTTLNTLTKSTLFTLSGSENVVIADNLGVSKLTVNNTNTTVSGNLNADAFVKTGGTNQQYLMANGSVLQYSANSGNSNFYLYNSSNTVTVSPSSGQITYNNVSQSSATIIYISHLTSDNIDIEVFYSQLSSLNDVYIQDRNNSQNNIQYNISGAPTITVDSKIAIPVVVSSSQGTGTTSFGSNHPVLISFFTNSIETDTRLSNLETGKLNKDGSTIMTGNLNMGTIYKIINVGNPSASTDAANKNYVDTQDNLKLNLSGGTMTGNILMNNNGISGVGNFTLFNSTSNGIAYFGGGYLANANKDFFIQINGTSIQAMITQISLSAGNTIRLSSGEWTENVTCFNQNYTICGAPCATFNQMTQIIGNFSIGSTLASSTQTRIRLKDLKIMGNLVFNNDSIYQELRTYIDNCDISGTITFPTSIVSASGLGIYFTNCTFSGSNNPLCTIPNQTLYSIYFTNCSFNSQPITNNLTAGNFSRLIFTNCSILPSLSLGNCVLNGLNASAVVSSLTAGSITLGGASTSFLKGNGGLDTTSYLPRAGGTMTGAIDMGTQNITNGGNFTANSFIKSGGTSSQFLKADGSIDSVSYPQLYTGTFTMTWDGGGGVSSTQTIYYTKIGSALGVGMVTLRFTAFSVTIGGTSRASIVSSSPISASGVSFTPASGQGFQLMAVPIRFSGNAVGLGWMEINTAGNLNIYGPQIGNYWTANTTNCGLNNICTITYST